MSKVADPIFSKDDGKPKLPPELKDKTAEEVAAYYERREQILMDRMRQQPPAKPEPKKEEPVDDKIDLFNDPAGSINRVVARQVTDAATRVSAVINPALIRACKITLKDSHPADYARFIDEIERDMSTMTSEGQTNPDYWEISYQRVKGKHADELAAEAEERGRKSANPVERSTPKGSDPPKPRTLNDEEKNVAKKFDMDESNYIKAADRYDQSPDLPLTLDSKKPRKKAS